MHYQIYWNPTKGINMNTNNKTRQSIPSIETHNVFNNTIKEVPLVLVYNLNVIGAVTSGQS